MPHPPLARFADWPERLSRFLDRTRDEPFAWGVNDCALRACSAVEAITGVDIADALRGRYHTELGAARTIRAFAGRTLEEVAMKIATDFAVPEVSPLLARRGDVV